MSKIDIESFSYPIGSVLDMLRDDFLDCPFDLQDEDNSWNLEKKSRLVESILLGIPIQMFFLCESSYDGRLTIIDGYHRLNTIKEFFSKKGDGFNLRGLLYLRKLNGMNRTSLPLQYQRKIFHTDVSINVLKRSVPSEIKYSIFQRLHEDDERITYQNMRYRLNVGPWRTFVDYLLRLPSFQNVVALEQLGKLVRQEMVVRFLAFYYREADYVGFYNLFLDDAIKNVNRMNEPEKNRFARIFNATLQICYEIFGEDAFVYEQRFNFSLWDCLCVNIARLNDEEKRKLVRKKRLFLSYYMELLENRFFLNSITSKTLEPLIVRRRFSKVRLLISKVVVS
ncbi:DUF262 domain-containing protein [Fibrobacter sp.]|uniref:GmrSD restriction endonuclease domain-containing protein n=1 Tax=Fibrobacter sp. TaxID=35828 RepID=UPI00388E0603